MSKMITSEEIEVRAEKLYESLDKALEGLNWFGLNAYDFVNYEKLYECLKVVAEKQLVEEQAENFIAEWEDNMRYTQERYG